MIIVNKVGSPENKWLMQEGETASNRQAGEVGQGQEFETTVEVYSRTPEGRPHSGAQRGTGDPGEAVRQESGTSEATTESNVGASPDRATTVPPTQRTLEEKTVNEQDGQEGAVGGQDGQEEGAVGAHCHHRAWQRCQVIAGRR